MKIIILGAGRVGATLAKYLTLEQNDITIIDEKEDALLELQERCDVRTINGRGSYPAILEKAGIVDADMLVAVTDNDEANMIACHLAGRLYHTPTKIARVRSKNYTEYQEIFAADKIDVDLIISPEQLVAKSIEKIINYPGTLQVLDFAEGRVLLFAVKVDKEAPLAGHPVENLANWIISNNKPKIIAVYRNNKALEVAHDLVIEANDEIFILCASTQCSQITNLLKSKKTYYKRVIIAGGGHIGASLASSLEKEHIVKIIELNPKRAKLIADELENTIVLQGGCSDRTLLLNENIEETDIFCALTNDDEANIMSSIQAKKLGAKKTMTLINKNYYAEIAEGINIDLIISPEQTTLSEFLRYIRKGDIRKVHTLRRGAAEAIEIIAHGSEENSLVVGQKIKNIKLPKGAIIGAIVRDNKVIMAYEDLTIKDSDHVIIFLPTVSYITEIELLFQIGIGFF